MHKRVGWWLAVAFVVVLGCGDCAPGTEGHACYPNDTCNGTLSCLNHLCVGTRVVQRRSGPQTAPAFVVNGNGTVTDSRSGLVWQQVVDANSYDWPNAKAHCAGLSLVGNGWRLPTRAELESIVDYGRFDPTIDPVAFPATRAEALWSSSLYVGPLGGAWLVNFIFGDSGHYYTSAALRVRCVRSANTVVLPSVGGGAPRARYTFPARGAVYDTRTLLTWEHPVDRGSYSQSAAIAYCTGLSRAGGGWRLPSVGELLTLVDPARFDPAIDPTAFPTTPAEHFWSSSPYVGSSGDAWFVDFSDGYTLQYRTSGTHRVRCVR